jgi:hypothetical protein
MSQEYFVVHLLNILTISQPKSGVITCISGILPSSL